MKMSKECISNQDMQMIILVIYMVYILIFIAKIIENCLATLRLILVANGKKLIGSILQGIVTLIWIFSVSAVLINIDNNIYKVLAFILGSIIGSYLGSMVEEKLALGNNLIMIIMNSNRGHFLMSILKEKNYNIHLINEIDNNIILTVSVERKKRYKIVNLVKSLDDKASIFTEKILIG